MTMLREARLEERLQHLDLNCHILSRRAISPGVVAAHLVTAPSGVWVLGSRQYAGRPAPTGGILSRRTQTLQLGGRTASRLVASLTRQARAVRAEVGPDIPVTALLCILDADWPIFGGSFVVEDVRVLWPKKACELIETGQLLAATQIRQVHEQLGTAFPPAAGRQAVSAR
jgi:hypothetical protein